jgi:hypothetical protein
MTFRGRSRWLALYVLCLGDLMIVLDGTIVNVSGVVDTAFMMGGAVGLAVLASLADARTKSLADSNGPLEALNGGYHAAFVLGTAFLIAAGLVAAALIRAPAPQADHGELREPLQDVG